MKRREAFQRIILAGGTVLVLPAALISCSENGEEDPAGNNNNGDLTIDMGESAYAGLLNDGGFVVVSGIIVANAGGSNWVALSSSCTHSACTVSYNAQNQNFPCPCHGSVFSASGGVVNGPATVPLKQYTVTKQGNILTIT
jgi:cytochrome b6-f complex iron-sulfur subunit